LSLESELKKKTGGRHTASREKEGTKVENRTDAKLSSRKTEKNTSGTEGDCGGGASTLKNNGKKKEKGEGEISRGNRELKTRDVVKDRKHEKENSGKLCGKTTKKCTPMDRWKVTC